MKTDGYCKSGLDFLQKDYIFAEIPKQVLAQAETKVQRIKCEVNNFFSIR